MNQVLSFLCSVGVLELTGAPTEQQKHHGSITPKLTMVAMVDGKAFFIDQHALMNRTEALAYCDSLGMRMAEITSATQFLALDQAVIDEWGNGKSAWTGGVETTGIQRYGWASANHESVDSSYIPYRPRLTEDSQYFFVFQKICKWFLHAQSPST